MSFIETNHSIQILTDSGVGHYCENIEIADFQGKMCFYQDNNRASLRKNTEILNENDGSLSISPFLSTDS